MSYDADATWWKNRANRAAEQVDNLGLELYNERRRADLLEQARQGWEDRAHAAELALEAGNAEATATYARVRELHTTFDTPGSYEVCAACNVPAPCDTVRALDGEVI